VKRRLGLKRFPACVSRQAAIARRARRIYFADIVGMAAAKLAEGKRPARGERK
jgi:hypothetical protein